MVESDEGFTVTLSNPSTGATLGTASAIGTIRNDDAPSVLSIATASADKAEGQSGTTPFTFTVTRTGDTSSANSVSLVADRQRGQPGVGFGLRGRSAAERDGELRGGRDVEDDHGQRFGRHGGEPDEGFTVTLSNPSTGATLGTASAIGTIRNPERRFSAIETSGATRLDQVANQFFLHDSGGMVRR